MAYDKYRWRASETAPSIFRRYVVGAERFVDFENRHLQGHGNIILGIEADIGPAISTNAVISAARAAWMSLRFAVPTIAASAEIDAEDERLLVYRVASSSAEAEEWAVRTVQLMHAKTWDDAHNQLSQRTLPDQRGDQTFVYVVSQTASRYTFIFYTDHATFDGTGIKGLMSFYLTLLARYLNADGLYHKECSALRWGEEHKNLLPPFPHVLADETHLDGPEHQRTVAHILEGLKQPSLVSILDDYNLRSSHLL
jgi:hypothetical protein